MRARQLASAVVTAAFLVGTPAAADLKFVADSGLADAEAWGGSIKNEESEAVEITVSISGARCSDSTTVSCGARKTCRFSKPWSEDCPPTIATPMSLVATTLGVNGDTLVIEYAPDSPEAE